MRFVIMPYFFASRSRSCKKLLVLLWTVGFFCGCSCAAGADNLASLMRACCHAGVSIVGLFFVPFLPFLISAVAVYCSAPLILLLTGLSKSFLLGFCVCAVYVAFSGGGWLISFLLLFTDIFTAPALFGYQIRCLRGGRKLICLDSLLTMLWFIAVSTVDRLWIVPLLREII